MKKQMTQELRTLIVLAVVLASSGCSNDEPAPEHATQPDAEAEAAVSTNQGIGPNIHAALCRSPLENDGDLHYSGNVGDGTGLRVWYYDCEKVFGPPVCDDRYEPILGNKYTFQEIHSTTGHSEGGLRISYECKGTNETNPVMTCVDGLNGTLGPTSEFETVYECSRDIAAPWCNADFQDSYPPNFMTDYAWDGGWGPGTLSYQCFRFHHDPPQWPPS